MRIVHGLVAIASLLSLAAITAAQSIKVDFNSTAAYKTSDGGCNTAEPSRLDAAQQTTALLKAQEAFDRALGEGKVLVTDANAPAGGDAQCVNMIVDGGSDESGNGRFGNAGQPNGPGVVFDGTMQAAGLSGDALANAVGNILAHEAGHKLGLAHNWNQPPDKMTAGPKWSECDLTKECPQFNLEDAKKLMMNCDNELSEPPGEILPKDLGTTPGGGSGGNGEPPLGVPFDPYLSAQVTVLEGPVDVQFGYMSMSAEFVFQGDGTNVAGGVPAYMTFVYDAGIDIAVRLDGLVSSLNGDDGAFVLSQPNPLNPAVYLAAEVSLLTERGMVRLLIDSSVVEPSTGGFHAVLGGGVGAWAKQLGGTAGVTGVPDLTGTGTMFGDTVNAVVLGNAAVNAGTTLVVGFSALNAPFAGGVLVPNPDLLVPLATDAGGGFTLPFVWRAGVPQGFALYLQAFVADATAPQGLAQSNGLQALAQ